MPSDEVKLNQAQVDWLLVCANTFIEQGMPEKAITLLDFLQMFEPDNRDCIKLLARACCDVGDHASGSQHIKALLKRPLPAEEKAAIMLLQIRLAGAAASGRPRTPELGRPAG